MKNFQLKGPSGKKPSCLRLPRLDWSKNKGENLQQIDLRKCPWCKKAPTLEQDLDESWHVCCSFEMCAVKPITHGYKYRHEAVMVWNCCEQPELTPQPIN